MASGRADHLLGTLECGAFRPTRQNHARAGDT